MNSVNHVEGTLTIGVLAGRAGISTDAVRYYERLGLLKPSQRTESGYRLFTAEDVRRLQFIRRAKLLGLSLNEIRDLLRLADAGQCQPLRGQVADLLRRKIDDCETKLAELAAFKESLEERYRQAS
ncbi:MAG: MerR family transcriptional regulator, partial [Chloroflexota bacterium]|nr:MerR family transcriptional regulator [Chloroflexota bacterium]